MERLRGILTAGATLYAGLIVTRMPPFAAAKEQGSMRSGSCIAAEESSEIQYTVIPKKKKKSPPAEQSHIEVDWSRRRA